MEAIYMVMGLIMFYSWIHSAVVVFKKVKGATKYEKVVMWVGFATLLLYVISTLS